MAALGGGCTLYTIEIGGCGTNPPSDCGSTNGIASINGAPGVPCIFYSGNDNDGNPEPTNILCIPSLSNQPTNGTTMTTSNPTGHPGDGSVSGTVSAPSGGSGDGAVWTIKLCPPQMADV